MLIKTKILIVDDHHENISALSQLIESDDVTLFSAMNANQALELISEHDFGLLLLDVQMPGMTGFELAKIIRSVKKYRALPIIFVTAHREDSSFIFEGYSSGAVDLLFKPLDANMVRAKVRMFVELAQRKALLEKHVRELEQLRVEADAANIAKSQFLANMSHEIRTPLAAVMGFAELIAKHLPDNPESEQLSSAIDRNGKLLMRLIDDILDLSKIEANKLEFEKIEFDLEEILHDIDSTLTFRAQEKGLTLEFKGVKKFPNHYLSDPTRIKQILLNIIGNAIKFTSSGEVMVEVSIRTLQYDSPLHRPTDRLSVRVSDNGIGLSLEQAERLFQPFGQADPSTRRHFGGSGLGLVISRQIARAMGGEIRLVESAPGKGSTFLVEFNLERAGAESKLTKSAETQKATQISPDGVKFTGKRILAVDDSSDNLTLISMYLKGSDANITFAENGFSAISEVQTHDYDLILMDVQMPGMDGHEATEKIRRLGYRKPIIALTAHAIKSEHDKCRRAGCDGVLTKPISRAALIKELHSLL